MCGYHRKSLLPQPSSRILEGDLTAIDARLAELHHRALSTAYEKQKLSLEPDLKDFLSSLPAPKTLFTATPLDICRFLVWKDKGGKRRFIYPVARILVFMGLSRALAQFAYLTSLLIHLSGSSALFLNRPAAMGTGMLP